MKAETSHTLSVARHHLQAGDPAAALRVCHDLLAADPDCLPALNLGSIAAFQTGDTDGALRWLNRAIGRHPADGEAYYNLGVIHQMGGQLEHAAECFANAASRNPAHADTHYNQATALYELGRKTDAVAAYERCIAADARYAPAYAGLGFVLRGLVRFQDAIEAYRRGLAQQPDDAEGWTGLGASLQALERLAEAQAAYQRAASIHPEDPEACVNLADVLLARGDPAAALAVCDCFLVHHPADANVLASKSIALGEAGDAVGLAALVDFDRFLVATRPAAPAGFASISALNNALASHLSGHPTLIDAPIGSATRHGRHTGSLLDDAAAPVRAFLTLVQRAVGQYQAGLPADASHPVVAGRPDNWRLNVWSIVLEGPGHQAPHIHTPAWISGVYYVQVPSHIHGGDKDRAGWIEFGRPGDEYSWKTVPPLRPVRPEPGLLILFPSYFFHRTNPVLAQGLRISLAFDVIPEAGAGHGSAEIE